MKINTINKDNPVIAWWSGGVTSAVTCKLCIDWFGIENVRVIFQDTQNEDESTYVFLSQCENWYGTNIEKIKNPDFRNIQEIWYKNKSLNVATGAICSTELKQNVRKDFEKNNKYSYQAFGFDIDEIDRAKGMKKNNPKAKPIFPLINELLNKKNCIKIIQDANNMFVKIDLPKPYNEGYSNNNCFKTMCVQGGIGYWQKVKREYPNKFDVMAKVEHDLTELKGQPVTMLKDQGNVAKKLVEDTGIVWKQFVFLKKHPNYPELKCIDEIKAHEVKPLFECNGFCGTNDLKRNETDNEINYETDN